MAEIEIAVVVTTFAYRPVDTARNVSKYRKELTNAWPLVQDSLHVEGEGAPIGCNKASYLNGLVGPTQENLFETNKLEIKSKDFTKLCDYNKHIGRQTWIFSIFSANPNMTLSPVQY